MLGNIILAIISAILSGSLVAILNWRWQKNNDKKRYKMQIFQELIAYRSDITEGNKPSGHFQSAINQVFIAYNDSAPVLDAFELFRTAVNYKLDNTDDSKIIDALLKLLKAMANDLDIDYSFSNDDLFTKPILISKKDAPLS